MTKRLLLATVMSILVISLPAQSPPPSPTPTVATEEKQQLANGKTDSGNPSQRPFIRPEGKDKYTEAQSSKSRDKSSTDWWIVVFTGMLTLVGILQYLAMRQQAGYMRDGLAETKRTVDAAQKSADAATRASDSVLITDRAIVLIDTVRLNTETLIPNSTVLFTLKNFGQTIAYRVKFSGRFGGIGGSPIEETAANTIAPQGTISWMSKSISNWIQPADLRIGQINSRLAEFTYQLDVTYDDAFNKPHTYHCEGKYEPALKGFIVISSISD